MLATRAETRRLAGMACAAQAPWQPPTESTTAAWPASSTFTSTRPATTRTGKLRTASVIGAERGAPLRMSIRPWCSGHSTQPSSI